MSSHEQAVFGIREYTPADFREICAIDRLCFSDAIAYTPEEMALGLAQRGAFGFVAETEGTGNREQGTEKNKTRVVAFVLACQKKSRVGHIITIDVLPQSRRKGLGKRLMEMAEQRLRARGAARAVLEVSVKNEDALVFYKGLGYTAKSLLLHYYPDGSDAWLMEKELA